MSGGTVPMGPEVGVGVNDRTVGNIENPSHGYGQKGEGSELEVFLEVVVGAPTYQGRASLEAGEALESRCAVTFGITPFPVPVEMVVGNHSFPKGGNFIVRQANVSTGYGPAGESADKEVVGVPPEFLADSWEVQFAIIDGGLAVAPPLYGILLLAFLNIGHGDPNEPFASTQAVA